jgi:hypothetical protein
MTAQPTWVWIGIADSYRKAAKNHVSVREAVREFLEKEGLSVTEISVASYWIPQARKKGFLEPTVQGRTSKYGPKLSAVADALNVDPDRLRWAVQEFANGKLAVGKNA